MRIARSLLDEIVAHARRDAPDECCGVVGSRDGEARSVHATTNVAASPLRFEVDGPELIRVIDALDEAGEELAAIYHSHTRTPPYPSETDRNFAQHWPGVEWLIVGIDGDGVEVRNYRIDGERVEDADLEIVD